MAELVGAPTAPAAANTAPIITSAGVEAENDDYAADSAFGDNVSSSTASVASSIFKYRRENGRTYHAYKVYSQNGYQCAFALKFLTRMDLILLPMMTLSRTALISNTICFS